MTKPKRTVEQCVENNAKALDHYISDRCQCGKTVRLCSVFWLGVRQRVVHKEDYMAGYPGYEDAPQTLECNAHCEVDPEERYRKVREEEGRWMREAWLTVREIPGG